MSWGIRLRGLILCVVGFGIAAAMILVQMGFGTNALIISGIPGAIGLVGLIELVSGYPFYKIAAKWDAMHGLVRFGLGLVIIVAVVLILWWAAEAFYFHS